MIPLSAAAMPQPSSDDLDLDLFWSRLRRGTVLIVGLSQLTGLPAAKLLAAHGVRYRISDCASEEQLAEWARVPSRVHPLVWKRKDGRKSMLLGVTSAAPELL